MESVFRLLLRASRDHQAALRAEVPPDAEARTVAVIGGHGRIGGLLVRLFADLGHRVLVADVDTELTPEAAAAEADVTVVSVPIDVTEAVIRAVGPHVRADGLLMDVTGVKAAPVAAMLAATAASGASVVGTHPMFGPSVHTLQGQRVVLCRGRGDAWADWLARALTARGLVITEATPEAHDRAMSVVQVLTHFQTQVLGLTLARAGVPLDETLRFTSPAYLLELYVAARHFAQSPRLYGPIEMRNPRTEAVTAAFLDAARELAGTLAEGDQAGFDARFEEVRRFFGPFTAEALEQSSFLIDRIVERA
jgi:prephenate dehydrogenase